MPFEPCRCPNRLWEPGAQPRSSRCEDRALRACSLLLQAGGNGRRGKQRRIHRYRRNSRTSLAQQSCRRQPGRAWSPPGRLPPLRGRAPCPGVAVGPLPEIARPDREPKTRRRGMRGLPWRRRSLSAYIPNLPNYRPLPPHTLTHTPGPPGAGLRSSGPRGRRGTRPNPHLRNALPAARAPP